MGLLLIGCGASLAFAAAIVVLEHGLPRLDAMSDYRPSLVTEVYSADGQLLGEFYMEYRRLARLSDAPRQLIDAVIAVEDTDFYAHPGVNAKGILRAFMENLRAGHVVQGGSTITQQVARELFLSREQKLLRKIREALLALRIESRFTKNQILELYLNQFYFGEGAYGVAAAAEAFFGKPLRELSLADCALIAGMPQAPSAYSPRHHPDLALRRRATVLERMVAAGYITEAESAAAAAEPLALKRMPPKYRHASYFMEHLRQNLERDLGVEAVHRGGLRVYTTLDLATQLAAEEAVDWGARVVDGRRGLRPPPPPPPDDDPDAVPELVPGARFHATLVSRKGRRLQITQGGLNWELEVSPETFPGTLQNLPPPGGRIPVRVTGMRAGPAGEPAAVLEYDQPPDVQAALLCLAVPTGEVRAWVGGTDFERSRYDRVAQARRQPGSSFKPVIYSAALDTVLTPASVIYDSPIVATGAAIEPGAGSSPQETEFDFGFEQSPAAELWKPQNYSSDFFGATTIRRGLAQSRNLITVKVLRRIGVRTAVQYARLLGIRSDLTADLSLALGSSGVKLTELATAYMTFAGGGRNALPLSVTAVTDASGRILRENRPVIRTCLPPTTAYQMAELLEGVVQNGTGYRARALNRPVAGKTGTTNDYRDAWFVGFSPDLLAAVWVGRDDALSLGSSETGSQAAAPIWVRFMEKALARFKPRPFEAPAGIVFVAIDAATGHLASEGSARVILEAFKEGTEPTREADVPGAAGDFRSLDSGWGLGDSEGGPGSDQGDSREPEATPLPSD